MDYGQLIRSEAERVWRDYHAGYGEPPAREARYDTLLGIAESLDFAVDDDPALLGTNVQGVCNSEEQMIRLRPDLTGAKKAFVLAHEIGHLVLKHPGRIADTGFHIQETVSPADLSAEELRSATGIDLPGAEALFAFSGYNERDRWETEANAFAAELLAPVNRLRAVLESGGEWTVNELRRAFGVSRTLIYTQLAACLGSGAVSAHLEAPPSSDATVVDTSALPVLVLDDAQECAASVPAPALIVAGPGAGKTRVLVERFARLVRAGADPRRILALTFANKAAGEMRERLASLLPDGEKQAAMDVSTFHAFGWQLLREFGHHLGYKMPLRLVTPSDALLLMRPEIARLPLDGFNDLRRPLYKIREFLNVVSRCKDENCSPEAFAARAAEWQSSLMADAPDAEREAAKRAADCAVFYGAYETLLRNNNYLDYGDLVTRSVELLSAPEVAPLIRARYDHILVDEFQDINYASGRLLKLLDGGRGVVWAVGDPKQSIYGFRGASPVNIAAFAGDYTGASIVPLEVNYRSLPDIVRAGQAIEVPDVKPLPLSAHRGASDTPSVWSAEAETIESEAVYIADEINRLEASGVKPGYIAILCRSKSCIGPIAAHLSHRGMAHTWGGDLEDSAVFKILMAALYLANDDVRGIEPLTRLSESRLTEPERRALFSAAPRCADETGRPSARRLLKAATDGRIEGVTGRAMLRLTRLARIAQVLDAGSRPFTLLCRYVFEEAAWFRALFAPKQRDSFIARKTVAALRQTLSYAARFTERQSLIRAESDNTASFLEFVEGTIEAGGLGLTVETQHTSGGVDAIHLMTVHRAKGLQWPVVFVPGLSQNRFPARFQGWRDTVLPPGVVHAVDDSRTMEDAHMREEACLFYVAASRAQDALYLTRARKYPANWQKAPAELLTDVCEALRRHDRLGEWIETDAESNVARFAPPRDAESGVPTTLSEPVSEYALKQYADCPRRYLYQFVYGIRETGSAFLAFHDSVKRAQVRVLGDAATGGAVTVADATFLLDGIWKEHGPAASNWYEPFYARVAREALQSFTERLSGQGGNHLAVGEPVTVTLPATDIHPVARQVRVTIDERETSIDADGTTRTTIRRSNLGKPREKLEIENKDVLYALYGEEAIGSGVRIYRAYPRYKQELAVAVSPVVRRNRVNQLYTQMGQIEQGLFPSRPNDQQCPSCPYVLICPGASDTNLLESVSG